MLESALGRMLSTCRYWRPESLSVTEDYGCYLAEGKSMRKIHRLALCASLVVGIVTATPAIASATPSSGVTAVTIEDHVIGGTDYVLKKITIAPGGTTGWHYHPGPVYAVVEQGTLTHNHSDCSVDGVYGPGDLISEQAGPGNVHIGRNLGTTPVVLLVLYISQVGSPLAVSVPNPGCPFQ